MQILDLVEKRTTWINKWVEDRILFFNNFAIWHYCFANSTRDLINRVGSYSPFSAFYQIFQRGRRIRFELPPNYVTQTPRACMALARTTVIEMQSISGPGRSTVVLGVKGGRGLCWGGEGGLRNKKIASDRQKLPNGGRKCL